jgi:hypothetical protein
MAKNAKQTKRRVAPPPINTVEELPATSPEERAELIGSLDLTEARSRAADFAEYDPVTFEDRLLDIDRDIKRDGRA